jgi:hypothetical protein
VNQLPRDLKKLRRYLKAERHQWLIDHPDWPEDWPYQGPHDFVLQHGRPYQVDLIDADGIPRECYSNSIKAVLQQRGWTYVEGYALVPPNTPQTIEHGMYFADGGRAVQHAWGVTEQGQAVELTWRFPGAAYLGVEFSAVRAEEATWDGDATILDDLHRGWPLLRQRWEGERDDWEWNERCHAIARSDWSEFARLIGRDLLA